MNTSPQRVAHLLAAAADLLDQGQTVNRLSLALTAVAVGVLLLPVFPASAATVPTAAVVALVGLGEIYMATQVSLNATLLRRLSADAADNRLDLDAVDSALDSLRLSPGKGQSRPIAERFTAMRRLLFWQSATLGVQVLAAIVGGSVVFWALA
jgi:hypothetical protein